MIMSNEVTKQKARVMEENKISDRLKNLRLKKGVSLTQVANDLNLEKSTISHYENGDRIPTDANKIKLAEYYGVTVESIFFSK